MHSYGLELISSRLIATGEGQAERSREFYVSQALLPDDSVLRASRSGQKGRSWSDRLNDSPLRPSHQLFRQWRLKWVESSVGVLRELLVACLLVGCDLKVQLGRSLQHFEQCPLAARSLLISVGLTALLRQESVAEAFPLTVLLLGHAPSHKTFRAVGRPPPHYGGQLEFTGCDLR